MTAKRGQFINYLYTYDVIYVVIETLSRLRTNAFPRTLHPSEHSITLHYLLPTGLYPPIQQSVKIHRGRSIHIKTLQRNKECCS